MAKAIVAYDKDLPEIADRLYWQKPSSYLVQVQGRCCTNGLARREVRPPP
jgi:hypothetical protein